MHFLQQLEEEVQAEANESLFEILMALLDKAEKDFQSELQCHKTNLNEVFGKYVRLKIVWHHTKRMMERDWSEASAQKYAERESYYTQTIREARRSYYVAKRRVEGAHPSECACRGCRCLKGIGNRA